MATMMVSRTSPAAWIRIAFAMFAVGWGANQFSPMLIVYRHELGLTAGEVAGLFLVYALTLFPGLLAGGPASDRFGRRPVVWPFVALSPLATLLLVLGPRSLPMIAAGRALAGLCSGVVFGAATAWVQEVSPDEGLSARRSALALTAGFGLGPVVAAVLAQWAGDPLVVPYLPHLVIGGVAAVVLVGTPGGAGSRSPGQAGRGGWVPPGENEGGPGGWVPPGENEGGPGGWVPPGENEGGPGGWVPPGEKEPAEPVARRRWPPGAVRTRRFWLTVAPPSRVVFGSVALAIVVLPEEVTSAHTLSAGLA